MGIEESSTYALKCDECPERWPPLPKPGAWKTSTAARNHGRSTGWSVDNFAVLCPACHEAKAAELNDDADEADELASHAEAGGHDV